MTAMDGLLDDGGVTTWRLLQVEDELTQLGVLERRLTKAGYEVETAMNGEAPGRARSDFNH
jgi:DNA-binding response OmpR family regulator